MPTWLTITVDSFCLSTRHSLANRSHVLLVTLRAKYGYSPDGFHLWHLLNNGAMWKMAVEDKAVPSHPYEARRSKRIVMKKGASVVVNLGSHARRVPCLIVDRSPEGFRLRGGFRLKRGQLVEVIPGEDELNAIRCSVVWVGKPGSSQEGEVGLQAI